MIDGINYARLHISLVRRELPLDTREWAINLVGVRAGDGSARERDANTFNDTLCAIWHQRGSRNLVTVACTTDPGSYWRRHPMNPRGTARLLPGHHRRLWRLGRHRDRYEALVQHSPCWVSRDDDCDDALDGAGRDYGVFGINCHRAADSYDVPATVDRWSAGCQVIPDSGDYHLLMALCRQHARRHGNAFDYTLIEESDLWTPSPSPP